MAQEVLYKSLQVTTSNMDDYLAKYENPPYWKTSVGTFGTVIYSCTNSWAGAQSTSDMMSEIYPNAVAHPTKMKFTLRLASGNLSSYTHQYDLSIDGTSVAGATVSTRGSFRSYEHEITDSAATDSTSASSIVVQSKSNGSSRNAPFLYLWVDTYFMQYDFAATAGTAVSSASVSSDIGYDGDSITFSCELQSGASFVGWYNGSTLVSTSQTYTTTVNGADLTLTAVAEISGGTVRINYNGSEIASFSSSVAEDITYNGSVIATISIGQTKTLQCANQVMASNVLIGVKELQCANQLMDGNVEVIYS